MKTTRLREEMENVNMKATEIVELFEDMLDAHNIKVPCLDETEEKERHMDNNEACLYGSEYWDLIEGVCQILLEK